MKSLESEPLPFSVLPTKQRRLVSGYIVSIIGWGVSAGGAVLVFVLFATLTEGTVRDPATAVLMAILLMGTLAGVSLYGIRLVQRGRRMRLRDAVSTLNDDKRPPVLFLRSFGDEDIYDPTSSIGNQLPRYEETLSRALRPLGPLIAIGKPGESLPETGAARLYVKDEDWRTAVNYFFGRARAVVIMVGRSEGLWWEIVTAVQQVQPQHILFFFPYVEEKEVRKSRRHYLTLGLRQRIITKGTLARLERERHERYTLFRERLRELIPCELPGNIGTSQFIDLQSDWTPRLLPVVRPSIMSNILMVSMTNTKIGIDFKRTLIPFVEKLLEIGT